MIEYKSGEELSFMKKSPHSPECVSSIFVDVAIFVYAVTAYNLISRFM